MTRSYQSLPFLSERKTKSGEDIISGTRCPGSIMSIESTPSCITQPKGVSMTMSTGLKRSKALPLALVGSAPASVGRLTWRSWRIRLRFFLFNGPCVGSLNGGKHAWVGRARTADARFLRSIIDRCVSLLDSIAAPIWLSFHPRCLSSFYALGFLHSSICLRSHTHPPPHSNRPPWLLSSRPVLRLFIPSLYEEPRTRTS